MTFISWREEEPAPESAVTQAKKRPIGLLPPHLLPLGREQQVEVVELLAEVLLDAAHHERARSGTPDREPVAPTEISTHEEWREGFRRAA